MRKISSFREKIEYGELSSCYSYSGNTLGFDAADTDQIDAALQLGRKKAAEVMGEHKTGSIKSLVARLNITVERRFVEPVHGNPMVLAVSEPKKRKILLMVPVIEDADIRFQSINTIPGLTLEEVVLAHETFHILFPGCCLTDTLEEVSADAFSMAVTGNVYPRSVIDLFLMEAARRYPQIKRRE